MIVNLVLALFTFTSKFLISRTEDPHKSLDKCINLLQACNGIAGAIYIAAGMDIRWTHAGRVCSGVFVGTDEDTQPLDPNETVYMPESGKFMNNYLIFVLIMAGALCCILPCVIIGVAGCWMHSAVKEME